MTGQSIRLDWCVPLVDVEVRGFRNLDEVRLRLAPDANYLFGPNAAGKTNLLEAMYYLALGRSFRRCSERELIGFGRELLAVSGVDHRGRRAEIRYDGREKRVFLDGVPVERLSQYLGWLPMVVLLLDDIELVRGAPALRRGFLDLAIAKLDRGYIPVLGRYRQALRQYNRSLEQPAAQEVREAWEEELVQTGVPVCRHRLSYTGPLLQAAARHGQTLRLEGPGYAYEPSIDAAGGPASLASDEELAARFRSRLAATRNRAVELKQALVGPHRDDILVQSRGRELRKFGSVGEQRLAAVALRLAEADLLAAHQAARPVFLLDEVVSELDEERSRTVLGLVAERGQTVYAAAKEPRNQGVEESRDRVSEARDGLEAGSGTLGSFSPRILEPFPAGKVFHVQAGKAEEVR